MPRGKHALSLFCLGLIAPAVYAASVRLPNPGAEIPSEADAARPAGVDAWTTPGTKAIFSRDTRVKHSGDASFHIRSEGPATAVYIVTGGAEPGLEYTATARMKTSGAREAGLAVRLQHAHGAWIDEFWKEGALSAGSPEWTPVTIRWRVPAGAETFKLFLKVRGAGEVWFDDLEISHDLDDPARVEALRSLRGTLTQVVKETADWDAPFAGDAEERLRQALAATVDCEKMLAAMSPDASDWSDAVAQYVGVRGDLRTALLAGRRLRGLRRFIAAARKGDADDMVAGWSDPTRHVFLRDCPVDLKSETEGRITAVRGEHEAIQLVLLPLRHRLEEVTIGLREFRGPAGTIPREAFAVRPVGYVHITTLPAELPVPRELDYLGWWPDPLLENFAFDVAPGDTQPVWISVVVPRGQAPGVYRGAVRVYVENAGARDVPLAIEVLDYALPDSNPWAFKNLLSWHSLNAESFYGDRWNKALEDRFFDFLLARRINVLSMYGNETYQTLENLQRFAAHGQNVFLLDWYSQEGVVTASDAARLRERLAGFVPAMKAGNLLDRAYVYGWDEIGEPGQVPGMYKELRYAAEVLAKAFPGVRLLSAGTDRTYGTDSRLKGLANIAFCPHMAFDPAAAAEAKANGNEVWWYDTWWTIDQHLVRSRLIPWQTFKLGADGYLMWCLNRWKKNDKPIGTRILTEWNPFLDGVCPNSSAMYVYPGEHGPVSSLRLENFRDGIEDYELLVAARRMLETLKARGADAAERSDLEAALRIDDELSRSLTEYTTDPAVLAEHRERLLRALVAGTGHN